MTYTYFMSFSHREGFGNAVINLPYKFEDGIGTADEPNIKTVHKIIENEYRIKGVIILYFKRLHREETP